MQQLFILSKNYKINQVLKSNYLRNYYFQTLICKLPIGNNFKHPNNYLILIKLLQYYTELLT